MLIEKSKLVFLSNELLDPSMMNALRIPLTFITFAFIEGKMFKHYFNEGTFVIRDNKHWGNRVVYGAIYAVPDFDFHITTLDSYHQCSQSLLGRNHTNDIHHRVSTIATPISFNTIEELATLRYGEKEEIAVHAYLGNIDHPKINQRLNKTVSYRIESGVDKNLLKLFQEGTT